MNKNKKKTKKDFDAIMFMREIRDKISKEISELTTEQIIEYFNKKNLTERIKPSA